MVAAGAADAAPPVLVWPAAPDVDHLSAEAALRDRGIEPAPAEPVLARVRAAADRVAASDRRAWRRVEEVFAEARQDFLDQRWETLTDRLEDLLEDRLELLARPERRAELWRLQVLLGMGYLFRDERRRAGEHFALALTIDGKRTPDRSLYGPAVAAAYADARADLEGAAPVLVAVTAVPSHATVTVDGVPQLSSRRGVSLARGLHVVRVSAPGHAPRAMVIDSRKRRAVKLRLPVAEDREAALAASWQAGSLDSDREIARAWLLELAGQTDAAEVVVVDDRLERARARRVGAEVGPWVFASTVAQAATEAMGLDVDLERRGSGAATPVWRRWWVWTLAAGALATAAYVGYAAATSEGDRLIIGAGQP